MKQSSRRRQVLSRSRRVYDVVRPKDNIFLFLGFDRDEATRLNALSSLAVKRRLTRGA